MANITADELARAVESCRQGQRREQSRERTALLQEFEQFAAQRRQENRAIGIDEIDRACQQFQEYRERWEREMRGLQAQQTATQAVQRQMEIANRFVGIQWGVLTQAEQDRLQELNEGLLRRLVSANPARQRARELLLSCLDEQQKKDFETGGWFVVKTNGRKYLLHNGRVWSRPENRHFCLTFEAEHRDLPVEDLMLSQALLLRADEQTFVEIARGRDRRANPTPRPQPTKWWQRLKNKVRRVKEEG